MLTDKKRRRVVTLIVAAMLITGSVVTLSQVNQPQQAEISSPSGLQEVPANLRFPQAPPNREVRKEKADAPHRIPTEVIYRQIFKHIDELNMRAEKEQQKGKNGKKFRNLYKRMARLDEKQARTLDRIAGKAHRDLKSLDDRAKEIVQQIRALTPNRRIEQGQKVPLPPPELFELAKRRRDITKKAIADLQNTLGAASFVKFSQFINEKIKPGIKKKGNGAAIEETIRKARRGGNER